MPQPSDNEAKQALKHPLRRQLFLVFVRNQPLSPREASRLVAKPLALVSYHVRELAKFKLLVLSSREPVRGALKNYYVPNEDALEVPCVDEFLAQNEPKPRTSEQ